MKDTAFVGKKCYNHLGGKLGAALFAFFVQEGWIVLKEEAPNVYHITEKGYEGFRQMGLELPEDIAGT